TRPGSAGNFSCKIFATEISILGSNITANGNITTGQIRIGSTTPTNPENYNITRTSDQNFRQALNTNPDSIVFWAKFVCPSSSQQARVNTVIHDNFSYRDPSGSDPSAPNHRVAVAEKNFTRDNQDWHRYSVPFDYDYPANTPAYILISCTTNKNAGEGSENDYLYLDDMKLIYNTNLNSLFVDGNPVQDFSPDINDYTIELVCGGNPVVSATAQSPHADIDIDQAGGTNTATVIVANGDQQNTYTMHFDYVHHTFIEDEICQGEYYNSHGFELGTQHVAGTFMHQNTTYQSETCDSVLNLTLTVHPVYVADTNYLMICEGATYNFYGNEIASPGMYDTTLTTVHGCDSTIILDLSVGDFYRVYVNAAICEGETYQEHGFEMDYEGVDTLSYVASNGCDSLVILNLTVNPVHLTELYDTIPEDEPYLDNGFDIDVINDPGDYTYSDELVNVFGCDSTVYLYLKVQHVREDTVQPDNSNAEFVIYPNPASEKIIIRSENQVVYVVDYVIYNVLGRVVYYGILKEHTFHLDIKDFAPGIYILRFMSENVKPNVMEFVKL
ncbi:MAG: T9SS type A sorting domain-containing protein, partial [Candidatus Delongbacteria bacterium]|nr:T9SS type A sorting domain-containing protein [Candidatus Delongbacteria bacterium]